MRKFLLIIIQFTLISSGFAQGAKTLAQLELEKIQTEQNTLIAAYLKSDNSVDKDSLESRIAALVTRYESLLAKNHKNVPVLVTFGLFLAQIGQEDYSLKILTKADVLDPSIPQIKNQLGNSMTESANFQLAFPYYLGAIELAPKEPLYHYQLGNLLYYFEDDFIEIEMFSAKQVDELMFTSFQSAAKLAPENAAYQYRFAEAYYDYDKADMHEALKLWLQLEDRSFGDQDKQIMRLQQANVHIILGNLDVVPLLLESVTDSYLASNKEIIQEKLNTALKNKNGA